MSRKVKTYRLNSKSRKSYKEMRKITKKKSGVNEIIKHIKPLGFHDDDMQICIKKESIDPSSPTINAELNFPKRNITLNSSNLSNSNSVETSVRNESDTTEIEDAVETSVRNKKTEDAVETSVRSESDATETEDAVETSASSEIETVETEDIAEKSIRSESDTTETENTVETPVRREIDETDIKIKSQKKSTCDGDYLSTSPEKSNNGKLDASGFKPNNKSTVSHLQNHIQIKNTLLTSKSRRSQSQFKSLQLDNSSETYDNSDASLKSPCKTKRSARSKIQPKLLPTVRNKNQLSKNDLSFTSNRPTSNEDVHEKI
ncbi:hypothetical protein Avbf_18338 [Armadillidium vulgare]|nr:hypothetical protein Avbf_18338 [Armadillidium vulgare]